MKMEQMLKMSLYDALKRTDSLNDNLRSGVAAFNKQLEDYKELPGYRDISVADIPHIDIPRLQKSLIESRRGNHYLDEVLRGSDTFVNVVNELYRKKHAGLKSWFFPLRKDKSYNLEVQHLNDILYTGFDIDILEFAKPVTLAALSSLFGMAAVGPTIQSANDYGLAFTGIFFALMGSFCGSIASLGRRCNLDTAREHAAYLDKKVEELYK